MKTRESETELDRPTRSTRTSKVDCASDSALLRAIIDTTPECIKIVAHDGRVLQMNVAGLAMIEAPSWRHVDGADIMPLIAPEDRERWRANHARVCAGEHVTWEFDIVGLRGRRRHMETHAAPIPLADGSIGQLAVTRDITERKTAEAALQGLNQVLTQRVSDSSLELEHTLGKLKDSERSFALLVDSVVDYALFMLDPSGRIASWNSGAQRIKGYTAAEIIGRHFSCFYTEEDRAAHIPERGLRTAAQEGLFETEGWRVRKDGTRFWANVVIDAIRDDGKLVGFAKITRDITERAENEARLRQAQKMEAVGQFTGGAAHDFNNLLMAILGSLELLRKRLPDEPGMRGLLDNAMQGARRGALLTQRMLAFARRQELKREAVDVAALIEGMRDFLAPSTGPLIDVHISLPSHLHPARTDATQLETALQNLALNARDAMPGGGVIAISAREEHVGADHPTLAAGDYICIAVSDNGCGMSEATIARATEPFFTTKGVGKGTGLGLSMVEGLMGQSGGRMRLRSELGIGTTVELWLPVAVDEPASAGEPTPTTKATTRNAPTGLVVLAVDDDNLVLMNVAAMLEDLGHKVIDVSSGARALEIIDAGTPVDLVISDQAMPGMTGIELLGEIRTRRPRLPVILATGYAELPGGIEANVHRLAKPFTQRQLADAVTESIR